MLTRLMSVALAALGVAAAYAAGPAALKPSPPVAPGIAAFPRLVARPGDRAAARINRALAGADAAPGCGDDKGSWRRTVRVTMRGPRYLSLLASDDWYCGGAYPDYSNTALVYDLATGAPVDWRRLLPSAVVERAAPDPGGGDAAPVLVTSSVLRRLYAAAKPTDIKECADVLTDAAAFDSRFMVWPDAASDGLAIQLTTLPHVVAACGPPITLALPELRKLKVDPGLLAAIAEARRRGWYDKPAK
jgi:hypothetical protein